MRDVTVQQLVSENDIEIGDNYSIVTGGTDMTFKEIGITLQKLPFEVKILIWPSGSKLHTPHLYPHSLHDKTTYP